ncbi:hypothetical protein [Ligilactobacillus apodemi]|uniref:Uncharacterized protein n=1 Tax=Ligilactobacillus apodemi DSM 16634 = JCM 16172 TaxID=1423724 RepID=A0A0R1TPN1_9LACO|nr:hypothetical protein [Ligilactobacillus apodemi]KRL83423.1 hypothetical protein FC32_GL000675 [Ligilactobacillus apodemi DSM 16634 = JCM 16172]MCR1901577.1 hypothetical protein [Ligilactobacillus apodemi]
MDLIGLLFLIALLAIGYWLVVTKNAGERDERQELIANKGYKYAFLAIMLLNVVIYLMGRYSNIFQISKMDLALLNIWFGTLVFALYTIWRNAYFSVKVKNSNATGWGFLVIGILNFFSVFGDRLGFFDEHFTHSQSVYMLFLGIFLIIVGATIMLRNHLDRKEDEGR